MAATPSTAHPIPPHFRVLVLFEKGGHHVDYSKRAQTWLNQLAADSNFSLRYIQDPRGITEAFLDSFQLFIQLDYPPYRWGDTAELAFEKYIEQGKGGWIGFHHATLLGEFDGYPLWKWYSGFMGGIRFTNYIAGFAQATVHIEAPAHPVMNGVPDSFTIQKDEWYTYNKSPRSNVQVLAHVDEASYTPASNITMGDHPVVWSNPNKKARNIYIFMGHSPDLFDNIAYTTLFRNAIFWALYN
ncbi:putative secreted glycosyl hydrolase [Russula earlei]|uniref:Secreted glycosyl hydrolase n=1 Tax=Russula earlei TaxID=71964 RepID=A0ACC0TXD5_9AGAM|nr:putative secreted glycosyl hydrolase [Russula earlei]